MKRRTSLAMTVAWPAFLMAGVLEMLVFSFVDPAQLHAFGGTPIDLSPMTIYSVAFFAFWVVIALASMITQLLAEPAAEINSRTFR